MVFDKQMKFKNSSDLLTEMLDRQRLSDYKIGLGFEKGQSSNNQIFEEKIKTSTHQKNSQWQFPPRRRFANKFYSFYGYCNYCNYFGHKAANCRVRPKREVILLIKIISMF